MYRDDLKAIQETGQQAASAISSVLGVDTVITNRDFTIVASTIHHRAPIGKRMSTNQIYRQVLEERRVIFIEDPGENELCRPCALYGHCPEKAEIHAPILLKEEVIGFISLAAFNEKQRDRLLKQKDSLLHFLSQMALLLAGKAAEHQMMRKNQLYTKELNTIMNSVNEGILALNQEGRLHFVNNRARKILQLTASLHSGKKAQEIFPGNPFTGILQEGKGFSDLEILLNTPSGKKRVISTAKPVIMNREVQAVVATFRPASDIHRMITHLAQHPLSSLDDILGESQAIKQVKDQAKKVAFSSSSVLITGESGTGKELLAQAIHQNSPRKMGPLVSINCAAIPDNLLESELFGYEGGAFTGARREGKPGKFELAQGGTLFLDEIGDLPLHLQSKLLRVLQEKTLSRIGALEEIEMDVRIISSSNFNLEKRMRQGEFRTDLFYRLHVIPLEIPPLRERRSDIPLLIQHFLQYFNQQLGKSIEGVTPETLQILKQYPWPGNIRELENAIEYGVNMEKEPFLHPENLPQKMAQYLVKKGGRETLKEKTASFEKKEIKKALERWGQDTKGKKKAAQHLGISLATLYRKMET